MAQQIECADDEVRQMAEYLQQQQRLAVWNASDTAPGIVLTRGGHCATKVGNTLCCSTRAMVPILRNRYIYFQMSILGDEDTVLASLSAGVSTSQMPLNTLVGSWTSSIGLCSTGQILIGSRWFPCSGDQTFGCGSTLGVLVYLDDSHSVEHWEGSMVHAGVWFTLNGRPVDAPVPAAAAAAELNAAASARDTLSPRGTLSPDGADSVLTYEHSDGFGGSPYMEGSVGPNLSEADGGLSLTGPATMGGAGGGAGSLGSAGGAGAGGAGGARGVGGARGAVDGVHHSEADEDDDFKSPLSDVDAGDHPVINGDGGGALDYTESEMRQHTHSADGSDTMSLNTADVEKYGGYGDSVKSPGYSVFSDDTASLYSGDDLEVHGGSHGHGHGRGGADERGGGAGRGGGGARMTGYLERFTGASSVRGIALAVPRDELLYPTLTLHSPHTQVLSRFCAADILEPSRKLIPAPYGCAVYGLDGSIILDAELEPPNLDGPFHGAQYHHGQSHHHQTQQGYGSRSRTNSGARARTGSGGGGSYADSQYQEPNMAMGQGSLGGAELLLEKKLAMAAANTEQRRGVDSASATP